MTDAQWEIIEPLLPTPGWLEGKGGRRAKHCRREIVDAILYVVDNGIKWRALPSDFPPWSTVYNHFAAWEHQAATQNLLDALREASTSVRRPPCRTPCGHHRFGLGEGSRDRQCRQPRIRHR